MIKIKILIATLILLSTTACNLSDNTNLASRESKIIIKTSSTKNIQNSSSEYLNQELDMQNDEKLLYNDSILIYNKKGDLIKSFKIPFNNKVNFKIKYPYIIGNDGNTEMGEKLILVLYNIETNKKAHFPDSTNYELYTADLSNCLLDNNLIVFSKNIFDIRNNDPLYEKILFYNMNFENLKFDLKFVPSNNRSKIDYNSKYFPEEQGWVKTDFEKTYNAINSIAFNKFSKQYIITYSDSMGICLLHLQIFNEGGEFIKDITYSDRYQSVVSYGPMSENNIYSLSDHEILLYRTTNLKELGDDIENGFNPWLYINTNTSFAKEIPITYIDAINTDYRTLITRYLNNDGEEKRAAIKIDDGGNIKILSEINVDNESYITTFSPYSEAKTVYLDSFIYPYTCSKDYFFILGEDLQNKKVYVLKYIYETQEYKIYCEPPYIEGYRYSIANVDNEENVWVFIQD